MANKNIPLKDKELVKHRLAQGLSTREAIKGTAITSSDTASRISREHSVEIGQIRQAYVQMIEGFHAGKIDRAKLWADMTTATKIFSSHTEPDREVPDWQNREKALRYIDELAGLSNQESSQVNILNLIAGEREKYGF